ncbi:MAG TPA: copper-binding protein [Candidatus Dormibacteraeota bacterium]|nr:copper-binding protein [Candidatus Dormibacteraeota bacterium]
MQKLSRVLGGLLFTFAIASAMAGCGQKTETRQAPRKRYPVVGKVVALDKARNRITVEHQEIPGLMQAMTMTYEVREQKEMNDLEPGDEIRCDLILNGSDIWLQKIVVTKKHAETPEGKS